MDSLNDILNRVLQNAAETTAQRVVVATGKRPLRDPDSGSVSHLQQAATALENIRSASTAAAMAQRAHYSETPRIPTAEEQADFDNGGFGVPDEANRHRKTTLADDMNVLGTVGGAGTAVIQQIAAAGRAFSGIPEAANAFKDAVTEMADSAGGAAPAIDSVAGPLAKMASSIVSQISGIGKGGDPSTGAGASQAGQSNSVDGAVTAAVRKILKAPKSFASWFGEHDGTDSARSEAPSSPAGSSGGKSRPMAGVIPWGSWPTASAFLPSSGNAGNSGSVQNWLNSSSIADSMRAMIGNVGQSLKSMTANVGGLLNGGLVASGGGGSSAGGAGAPSLSGRIGESFDKMLAQSWGMFRGMSAGSGGSFGASSSGNSSGGSGGGNNGGGDDGNDGGNDDSGNNQGNSGQGLFGGLRNQIRTRIGRAGRRILARRFRRGVVNGRRLMRGGGGTGGAAGGGAAAGGNAGGAGGGGAGFFARMFGGGGAGAGGAGAAAGGGGAGAAAGGGGAAAGGVVAAGAVLAIVAFVAAIGIAIYALMKLGKQGYETALRVAHLDGGLTAAKAQLDVSRLLRDIQTSRTLSNAGANHMEAINRLEENLRPITDGAMLAGLHALTFGLNIVNAVFEAVRNSGIGLIKAFNEIEKSMGFDFINDNMVKALEDLKNGNGPQQVLEAAPLHNMFVNLPAAAPPRPPLPPLGGN
jgi:hypothetical protein